MKTSIQELKKLLAEGKIYSVTKILMYLSQNNSDIHNNFIQQSFRLYHRNNLEINKNREETLNKICQALLYFIDEYNNEILLLIQEAEINESDNKDINMNLSPIERYALEYELELNEKITSEEYNELNSQLQELKSYIEQNPEKEASVYISNPQYFIEDVKKASFEEFHRIAKQNNQIIETILPNISFLDENIEQNSTINNEEPILVSKLTYLWNNHPNTANAIIMGEGGSGKTYSLYNLWQYYLHLDKNIIPIYISINDINEKSLLNEIVEKIFVQKLTLSTKEIKSNIINGIFSKNFIENQYRFIIILDGLNEIIDANNIFIFLNKFVGKWKCVQFIISSRYVSNHNILNAFATLKVKPLISQIIEEYLKSKQIINSNKNIIKLLENPMRLCMYTHSYKKIDMFITKYQSNSTFKNKINYFAFANDIDKQKTLFKPQEIPYSKGELSFNYLLCLCIEEIEEWEKKNQKEHIEKIKSYLKLAIHHILPAIAHYCELNNKNIISDTDICKIITDTKSPYYISNQTDTSVPF